MLLPQVAQNDASSLQPGQEGEYYPPSGGHIVQLAVDAPPSNHLSAHCIGAIHHHRDLDRVKCHSGARKPASSPGWAAGTLSSLRMKQDVMMRTDA